MLQALKWYFLILYSTRFSEMIFDSFVHVSGNYIKFKVTLSLFVRFLFERFDNSIYLRTEKCWNCLTQISRKVLIKIWLSLFKTAVEVSQKILNSHISQQCLIIQNFISSVQNINFTRSFCLMSFNYHEKLTSCFERIFETIIKILRNIFKALLKLNP